MEDMGLEEEFLSTVLAESTKLHYKKGLAYFKEFVGVSKAEELKSLNKPETRVLQFFQWLQKEKGLNQNSARARIVPIQSFFTYIDRPLKLKHKLPDIGLRVESWVPSLDDIQKLFRLGDISVKAWLSLSRDCPARISDLLRITPSQIEQGEFVLMSQKENVVGKVYISDETKALFKQLINSGLKLPTTSRGIDKMIASACHVAGFPKRINQHLLRKFWISHAVNAGLNEATVKILSFKSVDKSFLTYMLDRNDLRDSWKKVVDSMPLEPKNGNGRVTKIEDAMMALEKENRDLKQENEQLKQRVELLQSHFEGMKKILADNEERLVWLENRLHKREKVPIT
jgi:site-specific recombinase XerD